MAKRFIDTNIFRKDFTRSLDAPYKLLWIYIITECDHAGLWDVEIDVAKMRLGLDSISVNGAIKAFGDKIEVVGNKWFIPDFIDFQYGKLNPENRAHSSVIQILQKQKVSTFKPHTSPLQGGKDMDKDKDKDKDMVKVPEKADFVSFGISVSSEDYRFSIEAKYDTWVSNGWKDGFNKPIKNWKNSIRNVIPHLKPVGKHTDPITENVNNAW